MRDESGGKKEEKLVNFSKGKEKLETMESGFKGIFLACR